MKRFKARQTYPLFILILSVFLITGCGGGGGVTETGHWLPPPGTTPTVTAVAPLNNATGVAINTKIAAAFSEAMDSATITTTTFTLRQGATAVSGTVTYSGVTAVFTPASNLAANTTYTATITTGAKDLAGNALASNFVWTFRTGVTPDTTRPRVTLTVPATTSPGPTTGVPANTAITAVFTEDMAPATILAADTFTVTGPGATPVTGAVTYAVGSRTAVFTPAAVLTTGTTYTATITTAATDLAGNQLAGNQAPLPAASNYVWAFTTAASVPPANVSVLSTNPAAGAVNVSPSATINATFSVPSGLRMDPVTVTTATFTVTGPAPASTPVTAASVVLDGATGRIATFTPSAPLAAGTYTATITGGANGVRDLAIPANAMVSDYTWNFTVTAVTPPPPSSIDLGSASTFGTFGGSAGMTNTGILTVINGNIGTTATGTSSITGFHDTEADIYTETPANIGVVNGTIYTCTNSTTGPTHAGVNAAYCAIATQARLDAQTAYLALAAMPSDGTLAGNLAGTTITPGVYTNSSSVLIQGGDLTLDAGGNANALFVFQIGTTLTVGGPGAAFPQSIILKGGAQAKNVFWRVGTAATINAAGGGTMVGTIIANSGVVFSTAGNVALVTLNGRALSLISSVTMVNTVINVPAP